ILTQRLAEEAKAREIQAKIAEVRVELNLEKAARLAKDEQLSAKDEQLSAKDEQLSAKDEQLSATEAKLNLEKAARLAKDEQLSAKDEQLSATEAKLEAERAARIALEERLRAFEKASSIPALDGEPGSSSGGSERTRLVQYAGASSPAGGRSEATA